MGDGGRGRRRGRGNEEDEECGDRDRGHPAGLNPFHVEHRDSEGSDRHGVCFAAGCGMQPELIAGAFGVPSVQASFAGPGRAGAGPGDTNHRRVPWIGYFASRRWSLWPPGLPAELCPSRRPHFRALRDPLTLLAHLSGLTTSPVHLPSFSPSLSRHRSPYSACPVAFIAGPLPTLGPSLAMVHACSPWLPLPAQVPSSPSYPRPGPRLVLPTHRPLPSPPALLALLPLLAHLPFLALLPLPALLPS